MKSLSNENITNIRKRHAVHAERFNVQFQKKSESRMFQICSSSGVYKIFKISKEEINLIVDGTHLFLQYSTTLITDTKGSWSICLDPQGSFINQQAYVNQGTYHLPSTEQPLTQAIHLSNFVQHANSISNTKF